MGTVTELTVGEGRKGKGDLRSVTSEKGDPGIVVTVTIVEVLMQNTDSP